jgi:DNA repair exonuclease SbcCD ATPase subunit
VSDLNDVIRANKRELEGKERELQTKVTALGEKERELQAKAVALEKKEGELVEAKEALKNWATWRQDLSAYIQSVCNKLEVGEEESAARRLVLIPQRVRDLVMERARRITQKIMGIILAHYPTFDGETVSAGWPLDLPDADCDAAEARAADLADKLTTLAAEELGIVEAPAEDPVVPAEGPSSSAPAP